jgi:hypothetical protein
MVDPKLQRSEEGLPRDDVATFEVQERAAREAHSAGTGTYLYENFRDRAAALGLPADRLGKLKRAWEYSLDHRREEIKSAAHSAKAAEVIRRNIDSLKPAEEPEEEPAIEAPAIHRTKEADWPEAPKPPEDVTGVERLLYPPGLLGHVVECIYQADTLRNRSVALMAALSGLGKAVDRKYIGPRVVSGGTSTVLYNILFGSVGAGKQHSLNWVRRMLTAIGYEGMIPAGGLASFQSAEEILIGQGEKCPGKPSVLINIDEYGGFLSRITSKGQAGNVSELPSILQTLWAWPPGEPWYGTAKASRPEVAPVYGPALSIFGACTQRSFYGAVKAKQIGTGFISRHQTWDGGRGAVRRVKLERGAGDCPGWLRDALKRVAGRPAPWDNRDRYNRDGALISRHLREIPFSNVEVEDAWFDWEAEIRCIDDEECREIWIRTPEIALRDATIIGAFHNGVIDWEVHNWAKAFATQSTTQLETGLREHMFEDLTAAEACFRLRKEFVKRYANPPKDRRRGEMTMGEIRKFLEKKIDLRMIPYILNQLLTCGDIVEVEGSGAGRPTQKYRWLRGMVEYDKW